MQWFSEFCELFPTNELNLREEGVLGSPNLEQVSQKHRIQPGPVFGSGVEGVSGVMEPLTCGILMLSPGRQSQN